MGSGRGPQQQEAIQQGAELRKANEISTPGTRQKEDPYRTLQRTNKCPSQESQYLEACHTLGTNGLLVSNRDGGAVVTNREDD